MILSPASHAAKPIEASLAAFKPPDTSHSGHETQPPTAGGDFTTTTTEQP